MNLCLNCRRKKITCICEMIRPFETQSRFIILMHPMEYKKEKIGTGRFSHLILKNSKILVGINFDDDREFQKVLQDPEYETYLVYPGENAIPLEGDHFKFHSHTRLQFILIDGTWPCAKKMVKLTTSLHLLKRVSFSSTKISQFEIKHQPLPGCLSTVESLHEVLIHLNRLGHESLNGQENNLLDVFKHTVHLQKEIASDPEREGYRKKPFSLPQMRQISKKWQKRSLFFKSEDD